LLLQYRLLHYEHCGPDSMLHIDAYRRLIELLSYYGARPRR
jgi:hypothetical protein